LAQIMSSMMHSFYVSVKKRKRCYVDLTATRCIKGRLHIIILHLKFLLLSFLFILQSLRDLFKYHRIPNHVQTEKSFVYYFYSEE
jgi:hypothetical protein